MIPARWRLSALGLLFAIQLAVPVVTLLVHDAALEQGTAWHLRMAPVDPYDPFRGRYVTLAFELARDVEVPDWLAPGQQAWAVLAADDEGFAQVVALVPDRPPGDAALRVRLLWSSQGRGTLELPFDRYYLPEDLAPRAEAAVRRGLTGEPGGDDFAIVRVREGTAVLEDLVVDGRPVRELGEPERAPRSAGPEPVPGR